jgi:hypothetical protein
MSSTGSEQVPNGIISFDMGLSIAVETPPYIDGPSIILRMVLQPHNAIAQDNIIIIARLLRILMPIFQYGQR